MLETEEDFNRLIRELTRYNPDIVLRLRTVSKDWNKLSETDKESLAQILYYALDLVAGKVGKRNTNGGDKKLTTVKEKLINAIVTLNDDMAQRLLEEWEDILLQLKLESNKEFLKDIEKARHGEDLIDHETLKHQLNL